MMRKYVVVFAPFGVRTGRHRASFDTKNKNAHTIHNLHGHVAFAVEVLADNTSNQAPSERSGLVGRSSVLNDGVPLSLLKLYLSTCLSGTILLIHAYNPQAHRHPRG